MSNQVRASRRKYHIIYKTTCLVTGRYYIGMHSTDDIEDKYLGSGIRLTRSVKKYGKEQHAREILEVFPSRDAASQREKELLTEELRADPMCLNCGVGGLGAVDRPATREETRRKMSQGQKQAWNKNEDRREAATIRAKEYWQDPEYRNAVTEALKSRRLSEEQKETRSQAVKRVWDTRSEDERKEIADKISKSCKGKSVWVGRTHSDESKKKMSDAAKNRKRGPLSQETKDKISMRAKARFKSKKDRK